MKHERYGHYNELIEAGTAYLEGRISLGLFEETVNRINSFVREGVLQFRSIQISERNRPQLKADLQKAEKGFSLFEEGIAEIKRFIENKEKKLLWQGFSLVKAGCDCLNEVMQHQER